MASGYILVRDVSNGQPIQQARVFFGSNPGVTTDTSGRAFFQADEGAYNLSVTAEGYSGNGFIVTLTEDEGSLPDTIDIQPLNTPPRKLTFHVLPNTQTPSETAGTKIEFSGPVNETLYAGSDGTVVTNELYPNGNYNVSVTLSGWESISLDSAVVPGQDDYTFVLAKLIDSGEVVSDQTADLAQGIQSGIAFPTVSVPDYEFIYPSNEFGKYFTTTQARMYIGDLFIDEFNSVRFALQDNQIPIYGYASRDYDAVGQGRSLVQGQLDINFISEGYLYTVLREYKRKLLREEHQDDATEQFDQLRRSLISVKSQAGLLPGAVVDKPAIEKQADAISQKMNAVAAQGPNVITKAASSANKIGPTYPNASYLGVPFDIVIVMEGAGRKTQRRLEKCVLTGNEQIFSQDGSPLLDSYSFIARRLR